MRQAGGVNHAEIYDLSYISIRVCIMCVIIDIGAAEQVYNYDIWDTLITNKLVCNTIPFGINYLATSDKGYYVIL